MRILYLEYQLSCGKEPSLQTVTRVANVQKSRTEEVIGKKLAVETDKTNPKRRLSLFFRQHMDIAIIRHKY